MPSLSSSLTRPLCELQLQSRALLITLLHFAQQANIHRSIRTWHRLSLPQPRRITMQTRFPERGVSLRRALCYPYSHKSRQCRPRSAQNASKPVLVEMQGLQAPPSKPRDGPHLLETHPAPLVVVVVALSGMTQIIGLDLSLLSTDRFFRLLHSPIITSSFAEGRLPSAAHCSPKSGSVSSAKQRNGAEDLLSWMSFSI